MRLPNLLVYFVPIQLCTTCNICCLSLVSMSNDMDSATCKARSSAATTASQQQASFVAALPELQLSSLSYSVSCSLQMLCHLLDCDTVSTISLQPATLACWLCIIAPVPPPRLTPAACHDHHPPVLTLTASSSALVYPLTSTVGCRCLSSSGSAACSSSPARMITLVVPSPTSSSWVRLSWIMDWGGEYGERVMSDDGEEWCRNTAAGVIGKHL